jgi:hypothetical protein
MNILTAAALALILGSGSAWAREAIPAPDSAQKKSQSVTYHEAGIVMSVDAVTGKLSVKDYAGKVRKFSAKKAKINAAEGRTISLADIAIGDEVSISYKMSLKGKDALEVFRLHRALKK